MKKIRILALTAAVVLCLCACGKKEAAPAAPAAAPAAAESAAPLTLNHWFMSASTWSSPNGATVHINATPSRFLEGQTAAFVVRMEGEEVANIPCDWNGTQYTASAELNGANGYCYYITLTDVDGTATEIPVNTPTALLDETLVNLEDALNSYCHLTVDSSEVSGNRLILKSGHVEVQAPRLGNDGQDISCVDVLLILSLNGEKIAKHPLVMQSNSDVGYYSLELSDVDFKLPQMEADHQVSLELEVKLSNGQILTAPGGNWYNSDDGLLSAVG